jgi:hypothetical protein
MKPKFFPYLSLITVILVAASCGKKDSDGMEIVAPQPAAPAPPSQPSQPQPLPNPPPTYTIDLQTWCWQQGGIYAQGICKIQDSQMLSWNWLVGSITTQTMIYFNDIVSVETDGSPKIYVGNSSHGRNGTFVAKTSGLLGFKGDDFKSYRIRNIHITRCYSTIGSVACP